MKTVEITTAKNRGAVNNSITNSVAEENHHDLIQRDGALYLSPTAKISGVHHINNSTLRTHRINRATVAPAATTPKNKTPNNENLLPLTFSDARLWLQPLTPNKLAVQWNLPVNTRRNCLAMFAQEDAVFVLRLYQNSPAAHGWKTTQRTLEFTIDINKRKCFINLENNCGSYTAEIGLRCRHERYIFIARSAAITTLSDEIPAIQKIPFTAKINKPAFKKPPRFTVQPRATALTPDNEIAWELRDLIAEEATIAIYQDFTNEGPRVLRAKTKITPQPIETRKKILTARRDLAKITSAPKAVNIAKPSVKILNANHKNIIVNNNKYQIMVAEPLTKLVKKITTSTTTNVELKNLSAKIPQHIRDQAEIILRGKVKKIGQRVRVGGLLIEPEKDGTFCVACIIRNGKLLVPVADVTATVITATNELVGV